MARISQWESWGDVSTMFGGGEANYNISCKTAWTGLSTIIFLYCFVKLKCLKKRLPLKKHVVPPNSMITLGYRWCTTQVQTWVICGWLQLSACSHQATLPWYSLQRILHYKTCTVLQSDSFVSTAVTAPNSSRPFSQVGAWGTEIWTRQLYTKLCPSIEWHRVPQHPNCWH